MKHCSASLRSQPKGSLPSDRKFSTLFLNLNFFNLALIIVTHGALTDVLHGHDVGVEALLIGEGQPEDGGPVVHGLLETIDQ